MKTLDKQKKNVLTLCGAAMGDSPLISPLCGQLLPQGRSQSDIYYLKRVIYHGFYCNRWPVRGR